MKQAKGKAKGKGKGKGTKGKGTKAKAVAEAGAEAGAADDQGPCWHATAQRNVGEHCYGVNYMDKRFVLCDSCEQQICEHCWTKNNFNAGGEKNLFSNVKLTDGGLDAIMDGKTKCPKTCGHCRPVCHGFDSRSGTSADGLKMLVYFAETDDDGLEIYNHFDPMKSVAWDPSTAERQGGVEHGACPLAVDSYNACFATPGSGTESDGGSKKRRRVETTVAPSGDTMKKYFKEQRDFYTACLNKYEEVPNGE